MKLKCKISFLCIAFFAFQFLYSQISYQDNAINLGIINSGGSGYFLGGVSFYDYDDDGWDDLTLASKTNEPVRFFKNIQGTFQEETFNIYISGQSKQVLWVDYDNDGDQDLFVTKLYGVNTLYQNDGNFVFSNVTISSGLPNTAYKTFGAAFGDYDNDGFLDLFLCNKDDDTIIPNYLYHNNGDGTFTNLSTEAGISHDSHLSFCASFFDYDKDGFQDIYISNDRIEHPNILYHNNGDGTFTDTSVVSGANIAIDAMSTTIADFNYDGWLDIYVTNTTSGNYLLKNNSDGTFSNAASISGTTLNSISWGANFFDADNDMDLDLYVSCMVDNPASGLPTSGFYERNSNNTFQIATTSGFETDEYKSFANAIGDIDNDGYTDFIVANQAPDNHSLWQNSGGENNWLKVKLEGTISNKNGIGSWVEVMANNAVMYRYTLCGEAFLGQNSGTEIFGLANASTIDYVKVTWLSGIVDIIFDVTPNQTLNIIEGSTLSLTDSEPDFFKIYPNPASETVTIQSKFEAIDVLVYDLTGRKVTSKKITQNDNTIDLRSYSKGLYFFSIEQHNKIQIKKVIVY